jgi:D-tyrosyl-tRNA(Tyr) deacylase
MKRNQVRFLIQRVKRASVTVDGKLESSIGKGAVVLIGVAASDSRADADYLCAKLIHLRIFADTEGRMNLSALDTASELLLVSQFTLYADCSKGRRPAFDAAAGAVPARELYEYVVCRIGASGLVTRTGVFQAHMDVELVNDGPVTILLESPGGTQRDKEINPVY